MLGMDIVYFVKPNVHAPSLHGTMETCAPYLCLKRDNCISSHSRHSLTSFPKGQLCI